MAEIYILSKPLFPSYSYTELGQSKGGLSGVGPWGNSGILFHPWWNWCLSGPANSLTKNVRAVYTNCDPYLDFPDGGERENETATDVKRVDYVDDDKQIPEIASVVSRQKHVEHDSLWTMAEERGERKDIIYNCKYSLIGRCCLFA